MPMPRNELEVARYRSDAALNTGNREIVMVARLRDQVEDRLSSRDVCAFPGLARFFCVRHGCEEELGTFIGRARRTLGAESGP